MVFDIDGLQNYLGQKYETWPGVVYHLCRFFTNKMHFEGISFGILPARFSMSYWILEIFLYTSWLIIPCFYFLYELI